MRLAIIFDIIALIGFGVALVLAVKTEKKLAGHPSRFFLRLFLTLYIIAGITNALRHGGIIDLVSRYEYYAELLFPPIFLFFIFPIFTLYIFSTFMKHDMFRRMQAEEVLKESERRYRSLFEFSLVGVCILNDEKVSAANQSLLNLFGCLTQECFIETPLIERIHPEDRQRFAAMIKTPGAGADPPVSQEFRIQHPVETLRYVEVTGAAISIGNEECLQLSFHDVTARKEGEIAIRRAKEEWERTFNTVPDLIAILDDQHRIMRVNNALAEKMRLSAHDMTGHNFHDLVHGQSDAELAEEISDDTATGIREFQENRPGGHYLVSLTPLIDPDGHVHGYVRVARDITELKRIEQELENTRTFLQTIIDGVTDTIMVIGVNHEILLINKATADQHAVPLPPPPGLTCHLLSHGQDSPCASDEHPCPLAAILKSGEPTTVIHHHKRHDGSEYILEIAAAPFFTAEGTVAGIIEVGRDITEKLRIADEKKRLDAQLFQQQKDQAIAILASGMAHDFNNLLGTVSGNIELLRMQEPASSEEKRMLDAMDESTQRMTDLTRQLLAYAKEGTGYVREIYLPDLIQEILTITTPMTSGSVQVSSGIEPALWSVIADPAQIRQMLANLLTNGFEAMPEGGALSIEATNRTAKEEWECSQHIRHGGGDYVHIRISDSGPGVPEEIENTIFDPFVSTKAFGRGLGLSAALGIAHNHGGCITVQNILHRGATFHLFLPRAGTYSMSGQGRNWHVLLSALDPQPVN